MSNKTTLKKEAASTPVANVINKIKKEDMASGNVLKKINKPLKKSSVSEINASERSAVGAVKPNSSRDVRGSSGLANTGAIISYD